MLADSLAVATIPVTDLARARAFYADTLGLKLVEERRSGLRFECARGTSLEVFVSTGRASGTHTQMAFVCADIDAEVAELRSRGVEPERVELSGLEGRDGIYELEGERGAWFRDPEGNLLAVAQPAGAGS